jgi:ABC-type bacteriocin/lantibiotic exporter with double-glycine peptidase domain
MDPVTARKAIQQAIDNLEAAMELLNDPDPVPASDHILPVPWVGQNVQGVNTDDFSNSDCGPACVAMLLRMRGQSPTVDDVSKATGLSAGYTYTLPEHLITAAAKFGVKLQRVFNLDSAVIQAIIDRGVPVIVLVHYGSLAQRYDQKFKAGHWIVISGYNHDEAIYNDPLWQEPAAGRGVRLDWADFMQALADCRLDGNRQFQGLVPA